MKRFLCLIALFLGACATIKMPLPGDIQEQKSANTVVVAMAPAWSNGNNGGIQFSLSWCSTKKKDMVTLNVTTQGFHNIPPEESLVFTIDGDVFKFKSIDPFTSHTITPNTYGNQTFSSSDEESSMRYEIPISLLEKLVNSKDARVRLVFNDGDMESDFCDDSPVCARKCFAKFIEKIRAY